jgi:hypothetical protein
MIKHLYDFTLNLNVQDRLILPLQYAAAGGNSPIQYVNMLHTQ